MLVKFGAKNFFSIDDWAWVDLSVPTKATDNRERFAETVMDSRLVRVLGIFGPNASGKTNLLKIPCFLSYFIASSFNLKPEENIPFHAFGFGENKESTSSFQLVFQGLYGDVPFEATYELETSVKRVVYESLKFSRSDMGSFVREPDKLKTSGMFKLAPRDPVRQKIRDNASFISTLAQFDHDLSINLRRHFAAVPSNIGVLGKLDLLNEFQAAEFLSQDDTCLNYLRKFLRWSDPIIEDVRFEKHKFTSADSPNEEVEVTSPFFRHRALGVDFPILSASHGTRRLFKVLPYLITALENGGFVVLDELDMDLHPHLFNRLLEVFTNKETNPKDAQLVFAAHNPYALTSMEKEEIYLADKDTHGATHCYSLNEVANVRRNENFFNKYLAGVYGAVPTL